MKVKGAERNWECIVKTCRRMYCYIFNRRASVEAFRIGALPEDKSILRISTKKRNRDVKTRKSNIISHILRKEKMSLFTE